MGTQPTGTMGTEDAAPTPAARTHAEDHDKGPPMSPAWIRFFGWYHLILALLLIYLLMKVWPPIIPPKEGELRTVQFF